MSQTWKLMPLYSRALIFVLVPHESTELNRGPLELNVEREVVVKRELS